MVVLWGGRRRAGARAGRFMHRPSAADDPFAPLGHHWQDATHEAFGVVTTGLTRAP